MIQLVLQPEPTTFDAQVRRRGRGWLVAEGHPTRGPVPKGLELKPFWRACLAEMHSLYGGICAYVGTYIFPVTGAGSVDHYVPKSVAIEDAYEWNNYRLACSKMNSRKRDYLDVLDPVDIRGDMFHLDLVVGRIYPSPALAPPDATAVRQTIERLNLDDEECRRMRVMWFTEYLTKDISEANFKRKAPFVWAEASRQGLLLPP